MLRIAAILCPLLTATLSAGSDPAMLSQSDVKQLIEALGSPDFQERETATKTLENIGAPAIDALRAACKSENPEIARRAQELLRKLERRLANEKAITPTMVELDVRDMSLDTVLAELSKQAKYEVVLGGLKPEELANQKVTVSTGGKTPFWSAVLKVCDAADLEIGIVGGFVAPGAMPYLGRAKGNLRVTRNTNQAVVLEAREPNTSRRPSAFNGAVLVEAILFPKTATAGELPEALLQVWSEPRLPWHSTSSTKISRAIDASGTRLTPEYLTQVRAEPSPPGREGVVMIRNPDGTASFVRETGPAVPSGELFAPNTHQAVIHFKKTATQLQMVKELDLSLYASVQSGIEPLSQIRGLEQNQVVKGVGGTDTELTAIYKKDADGKLVADVTLSYDSKTVHPVGISDSLPGVKGTTNLGYGNHTVYGVSVTDKNGKPYELGLRNGTNQLNANKHVVIKLTFELIPDRNATEPPANITFWGTHAQQIEVPLTFKDVPLRMRK